MPILPNTCANDNSDAAAAALDRALTHFRQALALGADTAGSFTEREEWTLSLGNELMRLSLTQDVVKMEARYGDVDLRIDGRVYRRHEAGTVSYHSLTGPLTVERSTYREVGVRNGPTVVPLELEAGIMERVTPAMAQRLVLGHGDGNSRRLWRELMASHRCPPSRSTLQRIATTLGGELAKHGASIEAELREDETLPSGTRIVAIGLDRTTVPMHELLEEGAHFVNTRTKPYERTAPAPFEVHYRMAYVGTVAFVDADHRVIASVRYGASADDGPDDVLRSMMGDLRRARAQRANLPILVVQDAAKEMWSLVTGALESEPSIRTWSEVIDHYHALEHFAGIAAAMDIPCAKEQVDDWKMALREDDDAVHRIREQVQDELTKPYLPPYRIVLEEGIVYLDNNHPRLHYADLRDRGFPIGSGPTEGACKSLITVRCKRSGQRWKPTGLRSVLAARTQLLNERLPASVTLLRQRRYTATVERAA